MIPIRGGKGYSRYRFAFPSSELARCLLVIDSGGTGMEPTRRCHFVGQRGGARSYSRSLSLKSVQPSCS
jgi:hypothetical protein